MRFENNKKIQRQQHKIGRKKSYSVKRNLDMHTKEDIKAVERNQNGAFIISLNCNSKGP